MSERQPVSRRASLKSMGAMGAVLVLGGRPAAAQSPGEPKPAQAVADKPPADVADVAVGRMAKGHS